MCGHEVLCLFQRKLDAAYHAVQVFLYFVIPKPQDAVASCFEKCGTLVVVFYLFQMLAAVQFDDKFFGSLGCSAMRPHI